MQILVAEDDRDIAEVIAHYLKKAGWNPQLAASGSQALALARQSVPDLAILDVMLPDISGLEVCRQMRQKDPPVDVIVITAAADAATRELALAAGASGFCHKSASKELVVAIKQTWTKST